MEFSVLDYAAIDLAIAVVTHALIRRSEEATGIGTCLCALASFLLVELESDFAIKPGWAVPVLLAGSILGLPICLGVGWLFDLIRSKRNVRDEFQLGSDRSSFAADDLRGQSGEDRLGG